ncbi:hypothetical protein [Marispirochaeta sp.]|uniref:hypothetical protein n=1 Tax=Marispirochaeta sp. TaxID=2038653 RepID=UPI0029C998F8|nr:hypothetical protein [Marispirochaeta sp.]
MRLILFLLIAFTLFYSELHADWYRSDALGRAAEPLAADEANETAREQEEYLLYRSGDGNSRTERLYRYGTVIREASIRFLPGDRREESVVEGPERRITLYEGDLPLREEIYTADTLDRVLRYGWDGSVLKFLEMGNGEELLCRQEYFRDPRGRLRTLIRYLGSAEEKDERAVRVIQFGYRDGALAETWYGGYEEGVRTRFAGLQALEEARMSGTAVTGLIKRESLGKNQVERSFNTGGEMVSKTIRGPEGRTLRETLYRNGEAVRDREYRYTDDLLTAMVIREPERLERRVYTYEDDTLRKEEVFVNRRLVKVSSFDGNLTLEEFYRRGEVITRRRYNGDTLISEDSYE